MREQSDLDIICDFIVGRAELPPRLELRFERINVADDLLNQYLSVKKVAPILHRAIMGKYQLRGISQSYTLRTAYRDIEDAQFIYRKPSDREKKWHMDLLLEWIGENRRIAFKKKDVRAMADATALFSKAIELLQKMPDKDMAEQLEVPQLVYTFKPELLNVPVPEGEELERQLKELQEMPRDGFWDKKPW